MKKRDIRTFFTVTPVTKRSGEESQSSTAGNIERADFSVESREGAAVTDAHGTVVENEPEISDECQLDIASFVSSTLTISDLTKLKLIETRKPAASLPMPSR